MEYTSDHVPSSDGHHEEHDGGLDMDIMHDFGEGVGVDMRDFPSHSEDDEVGGIVGTLNQVAVPPHPNREVFSCTMSGKVKTDGSFPFDT